jgi:mannose-1-phosphate guanylyltransferase
MEMNPLDRLLIFIMAGGSGERFWPVSRTATPKHLLRLLGEQTLLEQTIRRFEGLVPLEQIYVLTNEAQVAATIEAVPFMPKQNIIAEPAKRDTAPAAALATGIAMSKRADAIVALFPADAMIHDTEIFRNQVEKAVAFVGKNDWILTFSIPPTHASTGFGYLQLGAPLADVELDGFFEVERFVEKPDSARAKEFFERKTHGWNAGMFVWQANTFLAECQQQQPALEEFIVKFPKSQSDAEVTNYLAEAFPTLPKISVDYAIMENAARVVAAVAQFDWDDVGSWVALPSHLGQDLTNNTVRGSVVSLDSQNNIVIAVKRTVALCGVSDLVVIETADAILVCHRDAVENIKKLPIPLELK